MRIGHYSHHPLRPGGIASYIRRLATAQRERGDDVILLCLNDSPVDDSESSDPSFQTQLVSSREDVTKTAQQLNLDLLHLHRPIPNPSPGTIPTVRTMHGNQGSCPSGSRYLARTGTPCPRTYSVAGCLWGHLVDHCGSRRPQNIISNFANIRLEQRLAATLPTMTVSRFIRDMMVRSGCASHHLTVVHSPAPNVPAPRVPIPANVPVRFVYAGRIVENKGVDWFLKALARSNTTSYADIAGTGSASYVSEMQSLCDDLGLSDRVTFHGWISEAEIYGLYRDARAVVVPSVWQEPAGLVTLEAAACGRPVIASRVGGIPEYADPAFSALVEPRDIDALATALDTLHNNRDKAEEMGQEAYKHSSSKYSFESFMAQVQDVYDQALSQPHDDPDGHDQTVEPSPTSTTPSLEA